MKNLIFIFADQWRRSAMGIEGTEAVLTPNFDQFAEENLRCTQAVSTCPLCSPHRASLLTGKHPINTGVFTNCKPELPISLQDEEICISDALKESGYATGYIGKWHLDVPEARSKAFPSCGAKGWDAFTPVGKGRHGFDFWYAYGAANNHNSGQHYWMDSPEKIITNKWSPEHETDIALDFVEKNRENPFALFMSWNPPHPPYEQVPQKYLDLYPENIPLKGNSTLEKFVSHTPEADHNHKDPELNKQHLHQYYAAISGLDEQFGRIVSYLKENSLFEDTYVVVSADHGDMIGAHGMVGKHVWYEESIGIPFLISGVGKGVCDTVIGSPDVMPTLLELMDLPIPDTVEGESCVSSMKKIDHQEEKVCYLGCVPGLKYYLEEFSKTTLDNRDFGWRGIRTKNHCFVVELGYLPTETPKCKYHLYDLKSDPLQMSPLEGNPQKNPLAKELYQQLFGFLQEQKDGIVKYLEDF
ncbi:MAG: sulfatase [Eubacteriales bacterium]